MGTADDEPRETPEPTPPRPPRRPRYRGTHPRRFEERYKELDAARHPGIVEHVRARGRTPAGQHVPILVDEILAVLRPSPGERGVDATLGFGGHATRLLESLRPGGTLLGLDQDPRELERTTQRLRAAGFGDEELVTRRTNFAGVGKALAELGWSDGVDFLLADLGVSSMQIDDPARGFTFKHDGPLDMRMNPSRGISAAQWLARIEPDELTRVLREHSDEPHAARIARALRATPRPIERTQELAQAVGDALAGRASADDVEKSIRRVFQALRIAVNDELGALDALLAQLPSCLRSGGRVAFLTFHSGEDRRVKHAFRDGLRERVWSSIADDVTRAGPEERRANPRASSAKLRWAVKR